MSDNQIGRELSDRLVEINYKLHHLKDCYPFGIDYNVEFLQDILYEENILCAERDAIKDKLVQLFI